MWVDLNCLSEIVKYPFFGTLICFYADNLGGELEYDVILIHWDIYDTSMFEFEAVNLNFLILIVLGLIDLGL